MQGSPRLSLREAQKQFTRERLLAAAAELFASQGYASTTIEEIATAAGATRATFYLHFVGKSDVVHGFYEALVAYDADYAELIEVARHPTEERLMGWLRSFVNGLDEQRQYWKALSEAASADAEARAAFQVDFNRSADKLAAGLADARGWDLEHARLIATVFKRQLDVANDSWIRARWETERERLYAVIARMWLTVLTDQTGLTELPVSP
jgi:AcrR family transcriptional regulator